MNWRTVTEYLYFVTSTVTLNEDLDPWICSQSLRASCVLKAPRQNLQTINLLTLNKHGNGWRRFLVSTLQAHTPTHTQSHTHTHTHAITHTQSHTYTRNHTPTRWRSVKWGLPWPAARWSLQHSEAEQTVSSSSDRWIICDGNLSLLCVTVTSSWSQTSRQVSGLSGCLTGS